jgi:predicted metal-dependent hydrolase
MRSLLQLTLDLFGVPNSAADQSGVTQKAPEIVAIEKPAEAMPFRAEPLREVMAPANFRHPRANRESRLRDAVVAYEFRRARRRTIGFVVGDEGLVVSAPTWVPLYEVEAAVQEKAGWILKKLDETRARRQKLEASRIEWRDGTEIPYLGEQIQVVLDPSHAFGEAGAVLRTGDGAPRLTLHVALPHTASADQIRDAVQAWLMRQARRIFTERLGHFAPQLGVRWTKLSLSSAGTRWGSASSNGSIRLNWRLVHFSLSVIDYVAAHELSHLRVMDHSPRFWETVATLVPDYAELRERLRDDAIPRWN